MTLKELAQLPFPAGFAYIAADKSGDTWYYENKPVPTRTTKSNPFTGWKALRGQVRWAGVTDNGDWDYSLCYDKDGNCSPYKPKRPPNPNAGRKRIIPKDEKHAAKLERNRKWSKKRKEKSIAK